MAANDVGAQLTAAGLKAWESTKANVISLKEAGLFKGEHVLGFSKDLAAPFDKENLTPTGFQHLLLAKVQDLVVSPRTLPRR